MLEKPLDDLIDFQNPYALSAKNKNDFYINYFNELNNYHVQNSEEYSAIVSNIFLKKEFDDIKDMPFIPVRLFKMMQLKSIPENEIFKTLTSSGTSGQAVSHIYLDKYNASMQTKVLKAIMKSFLGDIRKKMCIVDEEDILKNKKKFSARAAGIIGFSLFGRAHTYSNDIDLSLKIKELQKLENEYREAGVLFFGFTSIIWQHFFLAANELKIKFDFGPNSIMVHGGGWKKLVDQSVSNDKFKLSLKKQFGISNIYNYYGMIEQTGSIYMECEHGFLHSSVFSDVLIRDQITYEPLPYNSEGLVQVISVIPKSYPGFSLLTEDIGTIHGEDDCKCGRLGKYFTIKGRMKASEVRGCSDTR